MRTLILTSLLSAAAFGAPAHAACKHEVTQTHTFHEGTFCSYWTYCYSVRVDASCTLPVQKLCIRFTAGLNQLDLTTISSPAGWSAKVNQNTGEICWSAFQRNKQVQPGGSLSGFCVKTKCNPNAVEGIQRWKTVHPQNIEGKSGDCISLQPVAKLYGQAQVQPGQRLRLASYDPEPGLPVAPLFFSPFPGQNEIRGLGVLHLDPATMFLLAILPYDSLGRAELQLPIPPNPRLQGLMLHFQLLDIGLTRMSLSNPWRAQIR